MTNESVPSQPAKPGRLPVFFGWCAAATFIYLVYVCVNLMFSHDPFFERLKWALEAVFRGIIYLPVCLVLTAPFLLFRIFLDRRDGIISFLIFGFLCGVGWAMMWSLLSLFLSGEHVPIAYVAGFGALGSAACAVWWWVEIMLSDDKKAQ